MMGVILVLCSSVKGSRRDGLRDAGNERDRLMAPQTVSYRPA